jgi:hypothetical protein
MNRSTRRSSLPPDVPIHHWPVPVDSETVKLFRIQYYVLVINIRSTVAVVVSPIHTPRLSFPRAKNYLIRWRVTILKRQRVNIISYTDDTHHIVLGATSRCNNCFNQANDPSVSVFTYPLI